MRTGGNQGRWTVLGFYIHFFFCYGQEGKCLLGLGKLGQKVVLGYVSMRECCTVLQQERSLVQNKVVTSSTTVLLP